MPLQPLTLLDLPPEIREKIYVLISTSPEEYILLNSPNAHASFPLNLLLANTQIYRELRPHYFTTNAFSITLQRRNEDWEYFLSSGWQDNRRQIRTLRLNIIRWGNKDFFTERLLPVLEDCILNGRLRDLEVRIREGWVIVESSRRGRTDEGVGLEKANGNLRPMVGLLNDPYLKRAVMMAGPFIASYDGQPSTREHWDHGKPMPLEHVRWVFERGGGWRKFSE